MRTFIFTDRERRLLERWLATGEEADDMPWIFTWIRQNMPRLVADMDLVLVVIRELQRRHRWRGYITDRSEFGSTLRRAESGLTRLGRGRATSGASRG
jgi:hypothetical protein